MRILRVLACGAFAYAAPVLAQDMSDLFRYQSGQEARWVSPENPTAAKGGGARENRGAKGHAFETIAIGHSLTLADIKGAGTIDRMWMTIEDRSPEALRGLKLEMFTISLAPCRKKSPSGTDTAGRSAPSQEVALSRLGRAAR